MKRKGSRTGFEGVGSDVSAEPPEISGTDPDKAPGRHSMQGELRKQKQEGGAFKKQKVSWLVLPEQVCRSE